MGFAYHNGIGVNKDISSARLCYVKAAQQSYKVSMYNLRLLFESGNCELDK